MQEYVDVSFYENFKATNCNVFPDINWVYHGSTKDFESALFSV